MSQDQILKMAATVIYMAAVIVIGLAFAKRANKDSESYFLGGRSLGPWVAAFSAEASDMSGWLLMGLPGLAYWTGLADAGWTAIGLFLGTYFNWLIVSKRLRRYSVKLDAITLPDFFSKRFHEKNNVILLISSLFIIIFFTVYAGQCLASCGKLFSTLFGLDYHSMMIFAAVFVLFYTFLGGFLAESASDFMQAVVMIKKHWICIRKSVKNRRFFTFRKEEKIFMARKRQNDFHVYLLFQQFTQQFSP